MTLDTVIECKRNGYGGFGNDALMLRELLELMKAEGITHLRCETPYRADSDTENAYIDFTESGDPHLYDNGTTITYILRHLTKDQFSNVVGFTDTTSVVANNTVATGNGADTAKNGELVAGADVDTMATKGENVLISADMQETEIIKILARLLVHKLVFDDMEERWFTEANGLWSKLKKNKALAVIKPVLQSMFPEGLSVRKVEQLERGLQVDLPLSLYGWETRPYLIPLHNGVLNTRTKDMFRYSPDVKFNWQLPYDYDPQARMPITKAWLESATEDSEEFVNIIRAFFKAALTGNSIQKFLEIVGVGGTGKSTLIRLLVIFIGEKNVVNTDLKNLETNRFEAAGFTDKRLILISDSESYGGALNNLKKITGGDPLRYEAKGIQQGESDFTYTGVVAIPCNEPITSSDYTSGLARRRLPVLFNKKIKQSDKANWNHLERGIEQAMEAELAGILNWALSMPDADVDAFINNIDGEMSPAQREHYCNTNKLASWLNSNMLFDKDSMLHCGSASLENDKGIFEHKTKLYPNYQRWCRQENIKPVGLQRFTPTVLDVCNHLGLEVKRLNRSSAGARLQGLKIRPEGCTENTMITEDEVTAEPIKMRDINEVF